MVPSIPRPPRARVSCSHICCGYAAAGVARPRWLRRICSRAVPAGPWWPSTPARRRRASRSARLFACARPRAARGGRCYSLAGGASRERARRSPYVLGATPRRGRAGAAPATRVVEANAPARERGIRPGIPDAAAVARCPQLIRRPVSPARAEAARRALLDACYGVSPRLEDVAPGLVHVDAAGLGRLVGGDAAVAERLGRAARAVGLPARVGVAGTRAAGRIAARAGLGVIIPDGEAD